MAEWTLKEAEQLLDEAKKCGVNAFTITGGEPMLHKNFIEIIEDIHKRGMYVDELNTNGYFINQQVLDQMKEIGCMPLMKISFDGIGHHDWLRNRKGAEKRMKPVQIVGISNIVVVDAVLWDWHLPEIN